MPVQYAGIREEHIAVRTGVGVFDVSHMGQVETTGPQALDFLQHLLSNDIRRMPEGGAQYSVMCREDGGVLDDLFSYRLAECTFLTVTNAANHEKDLAWLQSQTDGFDVDVVDRAADFAMLAVQGPKARELVRTLSDGALPGRFRVCERSVAGAAVLVCGTGYTGEDGVELLTRPEDASGLWDAITQAGATPVGLGARDTLRLEVCFHLYGNDMDENRNPIEAGLGWCCKERTGFIGSDAVAAARQDGPAEKLVPFAIEGQGIARQGNPVIGGGEVTSGTFSPCLERGIGMAYVSTARAAEGTPIEIDVRGRTRPAIVERKPLYKRERR
jgi:aminomethyltransferase